MNKKEAYTQIFEAFESKYSFLGELFAEEFLLAVASYNIQQYSQPEFRVRRHPLLFWQHGWFKSSLLLQAYKLLGEDLCIPMSDVTMAALRGTVEHGNFIVPFTLKRPFAISTEFGQIVGGDKELIQKLLNVLEEGIVNVTLAKIATLHGTEMDKAVDKYGVKFVDSNSFTYHTNWVLMGATYNNKFLIDNAFESRFVLVNPTKKLDSTLIKHVHKSPPFVVDDEAVQFMRKSVNDQTPIECMVKLPDEIYEHDLNPRDFSMLMSNLLCKRWWGFNPSKDDALKLAEEIKLRRERVWKSAEDRVFEALEEGPKTIIEIAKTKDLSTRAVYKAIRDLRASKIYDEDGKIKYKIM